MQNLSVNLLLLKGKPEWTVKLRCRKTCRNGGENLFCKIRKCCLKKEIEGCWECNDFENCSKLEFLKYNQGKAHMKN
ncbi:MAG: hypothetical protein DRH89_01965 [Candidatus Cloacimonadota bacterium]|nr:MAG: hypothetical protein DRH89_01965 [Candidatus Cloacimonadota bacterium]